MGISEKVAYLKGLIEGMEIKADSKEGKIYAAICDVLASIAVEVEDHADSIAELDDAIGIIDEDLEDLESYIYDDEEDDDDDCDCDCCHCDDDEDEDDEFDGEEDTLFCVTCPTCGDEVYVDEGMLEEGSMDCPNCGELLEFEFDDDCECDCECDDDCCCGCHDHDEE